MKDAVLSPALLLSDDRISKMLEEFKERISLLKIKYPDYVLVERGLGSAEEISDAIERTRKMCMNAGVEVNQHFRVVFTSSGERVVKTWMLSELALKFTVIHIDSDSPLLARLQLRMLK